MTGIAPRDTDLESEIIAVELKIHEIEGDIARNPHIKPGTWWHADRTRQLKHARAHLARLNARARKIVERS